jgi:hypothetical protein
MNADDLFSGRDEAIYREKSSQSGRGAGREDKKTVADFIEILNNQTNIKQCHGGNPNG